MTIPAYKYLSLNPLRDVDDDWERTMFNSQLNNILYPLYHNYKMEDSSSDLPILEWLIVGFTKKYFLKKYITPPDEYEVMNNDKDFCEFRREMITYLYQEFAVAYQEYVVDFDEDEEDEE